MECGLNGVCIMRRAVDSCVINIRQSGYVRRLRQSDEGDAYAGRGGTSPVYDRWKGVAAVRRRRSPGRRLQRTSLIAASCLHAVRQHGHDAF